MDLRLGINLLIFCKGRAEIANLSGDHVDSVRQGQFDPEGGSAPYLRLKFYPTVMQLHKSKCIGQSDAGTATDDDDASIAKGLGRHGELL